MGFDSRDGRGERAILSTQRNYVKPLLDHTGNRIVFSDRLTKKVYVVNWDGTGKRLLCDGFALDVWSAPNDEAEWVYVCSRIGKMDRYTYRNIRRIRLDDPHHVENVWNKTLISPDNFQLSADGSRASGVFPWPNGGVAQLPNKAWRALARGCWASMAPDNSYLCWVFDGPHRNLLMFSQKSRQPWKVRVDNQPGNNRYEVFHPRWSNHVQFLAVSGPYSVEGPVNRISGAGPQVEIYLGRFRRDFRAVEKWIPITHNRYGDYYPDAWIAGGELSSQLAQSAQENRKTSVANKPLRTDPPTESVILARCVELSMIPTPQSILPYRRALVAHRYHIEQAEQGKIDHSDILIAHWAIRDSKILPQARVEAGQLVRLRVKPYPDNGELQGERLIMTVDQIDLPLYYDITNEVPARE